MDEAFDDRCLISLIIQRFGLGWYDSAQLRSYIVHTLLSDKFDLSTVPT